MTRKNYLLRMLCVLLVLCFCLTGFATSPTESPAIADEKEAASDESVSASGYDISDLTVENLPEELTDGSEDELDRAVTLDTEDSENLASFTLINEDGSKTAFIYEQPIKFVDTEANAIKFIDNTITEMDDETYAFTNADNDIDILFPEHVEDGISLQQTDGIDFSMLPVTDETSSAEYNDSFELKGASQKVVEYDNAFGEGIHLQYSAFASGFKENVIIDEYNSDLSSLQFIIKAPGLVPETETGTSINFVDEQTGEFVCIIEPTFIEDSFDGEIDIENPERHISFDNYYTIEVLGNYEYLLTSVLDTEFLESETTVYPVLVDPSVTISAGNILSATTHSQGATILNPPVTEVNPTVNSVGISGATDRMYTYIKTNAIGNYKYINPTKITSAYYQATEVSGSTTAGDIKIWKTNITTPVANVTNSILANGKSTLESTTAAGSGNVTYNFPITNLVKGWLGNALGETGFSQDYGFIMEFSPSGQFPIGFKQFGAKGHASPPSIVINYTEDTSITNGIYYVKNARSGKYLDVPNNSITSGVQCVQNTFNGGFSQQWQVKLLSDGSYVLRPMHPVLRSHALEVYTCDATPGAKVDIWSTNVPTPPNYAQWKIIRNNGDYPYIPVGSASYRLMSVCSGMSQALSTKSLSNNCTQETYNATGYDQWVFERVTYNYNLLANSIDQSGGSHGHTAIYNYATIPGYKKNTYTNPTPAQALEAFTTATVLITMTHGSGTSIGGYTSAGGYEIYLTTSSIASADLSKVRFVYYGACSTASGGATNKSNLVNVTALRGAKVVMGFTDLTYCPYAYLWVDHLMNRVAEGDTLASAIAYADTKITPKSICWDGERVTLGDTSDNFLYYSP